jgi:Kef-type K+ transport system membrane component KefB
MNTRGLMELIILNIGFDIKVISPAVFSMMVLMALVTTFMTTPLLRWIYRAGSREQDKQATRVEVAEMATLAAD